MKSAIKKEWNYEAAYELPQAANANKPQEYDHKDFMTMLTDMKKDAKLDRRFFFAARLGIPTAIIGTAKQIMDGASAIATTMDKSGKLDTSLITAEDWVKACIIFTAFSLAYGVDYVIGRKIHKTGNTFNKAAEYYTAETMRSNTHKFPADIANFEKYIENEAAHSNKYRCLKDKTHLMISGTVLALMVAFSVKQNWDNIIDFKKEISQSVQKPSSAKAKSSNELMPRN